MAGAAKHVPNLVPNEFLHGGSGGAKVFPRIKFLWIFGENLADACRHGNAQIRVNIHLGAAGPPGDFDIRLGDPLGIGHGSPYLFTSATRSWGTLEAP